MNRLEHLEKFVNFRRQLHMYPQIGFKQFQTRERIKRFLRQLGIKDNHWVEMAKTGLVVDIHGLAPPQGQKKCVALRAQMDALQMTQDNHHLEYRSKNHKAAHMCGHDGHVACMMGFLSLYMKIISKVPKNKTIRILFQPSEEGPLSGAKLMIEEGCMNNVDEVYGFHQAPILPQGELLCTQGVLMSQVKVMYITLKAKCGGHSSSDTNKNHSAIAQAMGLYHKLNQLFDAVAQQRKGLFIGAIPVFHSGERFNVISRTAYMEGTLRSLEMGVINIVIQKIENIVKQTRSRGFQIQLKFTEGFPSLINSKLQTQNILKIGQKVFGKEKISKKGCPNLASEDFAYFTKQKPGAFFFVTSGKGKQIQENVHDSNFDFNDVLIEKVANFWYLLAIDRLNIKLQ